MTQAGTPTDEARRDLRSQAWLERLKAIRRDRLTRGFAWAICCVLALFLPLLALDQAWLGAALACAALAGALRIRRLAERGTPRAGAAALVLFWLIATTASATTGGIGTVSIGWLFLFPLVGGLMLERRGALLGSGLTVLSMLGLLAAEHQAIPLPILVDESFRALHDLLDTVAISVTAAIFVWLYLREQRWAEDEMLAGIRRLEQEVDVRSAAEQEAVRAQQAEQRFLAVASHELRTPLNGVLGLTQILAARDLGAENDELVRDLQGAGMQLLSLVNQILDFSATAVPDRTAAPFDLRDLLSSVRGMLAGQAGSDVTVRVDLDDGWPTRRLGDGDRVAQILLNLGGNALKFTERGEVVLGAQPLPDDPDRVRCSMRDTGVGIDPGDRERLFEPFVRADDAAPSARGLGLGLAIVKDLVVSMGGIIEVESTPGAGTTFLVELPLPAAPATADERPHADSTDVEAPAHRPARETPRVLVAEDDPVSRMVLTTFLAELGWEVTSVDDGQCALDELSSGSYILGLVDGDLPHQTGDQVARELRRRAIDTPLIAVTAFAMPGDRERFLGAGMNAYLSKPVRFEELRTLIDDLDLPT